MEVRFVTPLNKLFLNYLYPPSTLTGKIEYYYFCGINILLIHQISEV
jgi:hypothetical protein